MIVVFSCIFLHSVDITVSISIHIHIHIRFSIFGGKCIFNFGM
jgi:hypothetical protein